MNIVYRLIQILSKTKEWVSNSQDLQFTDIYSEWASKRELLEQLNSYISSANDGTLKAQKIERLFAPTIGLCEIVKSEADVQTYLDISAEFDHWLRSV